MSPGSMLPAAGFLLLFAIGLGVHLAAQSRQSRRRLDERFKAALNRHERITFVDLYASVELATPPMATGRASLPSRVFGFNPNRLDLYPLHPTGVIIVALPAALVVAAALSLIVGRAGFFAVPLLWPVMTRMSFSRWHQKRASSLFEQFPDALAMVVRAVRVGIPVGEAIGAVARDSAPPTAGEFTRVVEKLAIGLPLDEALHMMAERNGLPEYRFFATALGLQSQTGGNLSETLEGLADVIRKRVAARSRGFALAAEARTSANVLAALPVVMFAGLWFMSPHYILALLTERTGHLILGATITLLGLGILTMRMLIQKSLS